ncbi:MAG: hypothetical protein LCH84_02040 [Gemmatimonadetes bacterium]|nr:hypothetical protein [Gemmatimonadota bacterium]
MCPLRVLPPARRVLTACALAVMAGLTGCDRAVPVAPVHVAPRPAVARLVIRGADGEGVVGRSREMWVESLSATGERVETEPVLVASSDPRVAVVRTRDTTWVPDGSGIAGRFLRMTRATIDEVGPGEALIHANVAGVSAAVAVRVTAVPTRPAALVVDSFYVVETRAPCAAPCATLLYVPVLRVREPTGRTVATIESIEFTIPGRTTGWCIGGQLALLAGQRVEVNGVSMNDGTGGLYFVSDRGVSVADGPARVRALVRDTSGTLGLLDATGPILRQRAPSDVPSPSSPAPPWQCRKDRYDV